MSAAHALGHAQGLSFRDVLADSVGPRLLGFAALLWNGGISFGGVASCSFASLIALPVLHIYRKYYRPAR